MCDISFGLYFIFTKFFKTGAVLKACEESGEGIHVAGKVRKDLMSNVSFSLKFLFVFNDFRTKYHTSESELNVYLSNFPHFYHISLSLSLCIYIYTLVPYNSRADVVRQRAEKYDTESNVK